MDGSWAASTRMLAATSKSSAFDHQRGSTRRRQGGHRPANELMGLVMIRHGGLLALAEA
jgi:hypothetical protein